MSTDFAFVTRQDILNFPFPYKLWLVVNLDYCDFLRWNRDGTVVLLDLVSLEEYLNSTRSIFKIKNSSSFLTHLVEFKFERLNSQPEAEEDILLQYKNENFQRHRLDLLAKIRRRSYELICDISTNNSKQCYENLVPSDNVRNQCAGIPKCVSERMLGDLCFMCHGGLSNIKKSRLQFQTTLHFNNGKRILKEKLEASSFGHGGKPNSNVSIRSVAGTSISEEDQVIELPVELFENPHDSVLNFDFLPEYAGYYGNCTKDQLLNFFGEYLPKYEDGSMEVKKFVSDNTSTQSVDRENNIAQYYSPNTAVNSNVVISTPVTLDGMYNLNFSSNFEPIFITNENGERIDGNSINNSDFTVTHLNSNSLHNDDDISMDEFLKFKDSPSCENVLDNSQPPITCESNKFPVHSSFPKEPENAKTFPQMPASFKMELNEDVKENEANFRNFFSQYRASLNLLYDRQ